MHSFRHPATSTEAVPQATDDADDPCPKGWRVPDGGVNGVWSKALNLTSNFTYLTFNKDSYGMELSSILGDANSIWYPASGYRYVAEGFGTHLTGVGEMGYSWSVSSEQQVYYLYYTYLGSVFPYNSNSIKLGSSKSVRCVKDQY